MEKHLHIIDFTIPYPANYGGVIDLFWKLPALQQQGVLIHLHCFMYDRSKQDELNKYCVSVNYYERLKGIKGLSTQLPYIVATRKNESLLQNLLQDDYPILMEGIHSTYLLNDKRFAERKKYVRIHNVEFEYYQHLFKSATSIFKKAYFFFESTLLKKYETNIVDKATAFWGVTKKDVDVYRNQLHCTTIDYLPLYLPKDWNIHCKEGTGNFCLYQGDLSVSANEKAALWLLEKVFSKTNISFVIAGKNPSKKLEQRIHQYQHTCLVANPTEAEMQDMIIKAHINILPSYSSSGIKLKLLNALYNGRHCVVNNDTISGSDLNELCHIANDASAVKNIVEQLYHQPFSGGEIALRKQVLQQMFNNEANAKQQVQWIWGK